MLHIFFKIIQLFLLFFFINSNKIKELFVKFREIVELLGDEWLYFLVTLFKVSRSLIFEFISFQNEFLVIGFGSFSSFLSFILYHFFLLFHCIFEFVSFFLHLFPFFVENLFDLLLLLVSHLFSLDQHFLPAFNIFISVFILNLFSFIFIVVVNFSFTRNLFSPLVTFIHSISSSFIFHIIDLINI